MKAFLKILLLVLDITGINALCRFINRDKAFILMYHGICNDKFDLLSGYDDRQLPRSTFIKQLQYLKRKGYHFRNMTWLVSAVLENKPLNKTVVLTFDDGFKNIYSNAYEVMKELEAKGCYYLVSNLVGTGEIIWTDLVETVIRNHKGSDFPFIFHGKTMIYYIGDKKSSQSAMLDIKAKLRSIPDKNRHEHLSQFKKPAPDEIPEEFKIINWQEIKQLDQNILEIGSHTRRHPNCENLTSDDEIDDEILGSKIDIENHSGYHVEHFCYPAGSYNENMMTKVRDYGYKSAVTTEYGFVDHRSNYFKFKRMEAPSQFLLFKARISGSHGFLRRIKSFFS